MPRHKLDINIGLLKNLYYERGLSFNKMGKLMGCSRDTIRNRLKEHNLPFKTKSAAHTKYKKKSFDGDEATRSYLVGFRLGDLSVRKPYKNSHIVVVSCHTTTFYQVRLFRKLFGEYGKIYVYKSPRPSFNMNCYLDESFSFLLSKNIAFWFRKRNAHPITFIAGYVDAEGSFGINQGRARFKIDAYDYKILKFINKKLSRLGVKTKFRRIAKKGTKSYKRDNPWNKDLWRLDVNEANSLLKFIKIIMPYIKHRKRISDAKICIKNILKRKQNGTI